MTKFVIRRIVWTIPVMLIVILFTFVLMRQIKGNPFRKSERAIPASIQANLERKFGLDQPTYVQYWRYVKGVVTLDLGPSMVLRNQDVNDIVRAHFPVSMALGLYAFIFAVLIGIPLGVISALRANSVWRLHGAAAGQRGLRGAELPRRDPDDLLLRVQMAERHGPARQRLGQLAVEGAAVDGARLPADGVFRPARPRHDAGDAAAGLRAHGQGEGPALDARRRPARAAQLADPGRDRRRAPARRDHHRLVHHREDLRDPRHRAVLRDGRDRPRLLGRDGPDDALAGIVIVGNLLVDMLYGVLDPRTREARA